MTQNIRAFELRRHHNHGRTIVTVRFCPNCGEIVNGKIPIGTCSEEQHAKRRRNRNTAGGFPRTSPSTATRSMPSSWRAAQIGDADAVAVWYR